MSKRLKVIRIDSPFGGNTLFKSFSPSGMGYGFTGDPDRARKFRSQNKIDAAMKSLSGMKLNPELWILEIKDGKYQQVNRKKDTD